MPRSPLRTCVAVIPARYASVRFPAKALADETGRPLVWHVHEQAKKAACVQRVVVAVDHPRVAAAVEGFGGEFVMTSPDHPNGASRVAEACETLDLPDDAAVVNVQGDEPELDPSLIDAAVDALRAGDAPVATIASPFAPDEDPASPHIVKVVRRLDGTAMYFSRALVPHDRDGEGAAAPLKHVGLYVYRRPFLTVYASLAPTPLEQAERLEQLRMLEHGHAIAVAVRESRHHGVDTPEDYAAFVARWRAADGG